MIKAFWITLTCTTAFLGLELKAFAASKKPVQSGTSRFASPVAPAAAKPAKASADQPFDNLGFHLGTLTEFVGSVQTDDQGKKNVFEMNPMLGFSTQLTLSPQWIFTPELNWVLPREAGAGVSKNLFMIRGDFGYALEDWIRLRLGTSLMVNNIRGSGGTRPLNNGSGQSDFFVPPESQTSFNNTLDLGAEIHSDELALRFQTYWYAILNSERRQLSYSLTLTFYYDLKE
jgi:hypothetical protein